MRTVEQWEQLIHEVVGTWAIQAVEGLVALTGVEVDFVAKVVAGCQEAEGWYATMGFPELNTSQQMACVVVGLKGARDTWGTVRSPIDRPGMADAMTIYEYLSGVIGAVQSARGLTGMAPEPKRPPAPPTGGDSEPSVPEWMRR